MHRAVRALCDAASILPDPSSGFPNLITMMVAERVAAAF
jgi:hypothetical protein